MKFHSDIDIDFGDRDLLLPYIDVTHASMGDSPNIRRHNTGVYVTDVPYDPIRDCCAINYVAAEERGYMKIDMLNVFVYKYVRDEQHLQMLMQNPDWSMLHDKETFERLIHIGRHYDSMMLMPEPIDSIPRMAMFLSIIRPAKRHLIGKSWAEVASDVWNTTDTGYAFKRSHAVAYAHLVVVHMNLIATGLALQE